MAPKSKSSTGPALRQGTLSFASAKRGSTAAGKGNVLKASVSSSKPASGEKREQGSRPASIASTISINTTTTDSISDDEVVFVTPAAEQSNVKRRKTETGQGKGITGSRQRKAPKNDSDTSSDEETEKPENLNVLEKDPRIQRLYNQARARMGDAPLVHAKNQNKIQQILRVFDTSYEYGPCVGMTRLQRWERAHALGLNPPSEVREILTTQQGLEDDTYKQCVFHDEI